MDQRTVRGLVGSCEESPRLRGRQDGRFKTLRSRWSHRVGGIAGQYLPLDGVAKRLPEKPVDV
jgi:hypothetical protein